MVELLVTSGADVNLRGHDGLTALHVAHPREQKIFELLVSHGAALEARDKREESTLLRVSGHPMEEAEDIVKELLGRGADIRSRNVLGETALFRAAKQGYCRITRVLTEAGADVNARDKSGASVLLSTISSNHRRLSKVVTLLLELGADVHSQDSAGDTALAAAAARGLSETVKLILDHNPHVDTSNRAGETALTLTAAAEATLEGSRPYDKKGNRIDDRIRMAAATEEYSRTMELLLDYGASVDLKNEAGNTALTLAAAKGKPDAVKLLLKHGANINISNGAENTALILAALTNATLVEFGLRVYRSDAKLGPTIYHSDAAFRMTAAMKRKTEIMQFLLDHGASIDSKNKDGDTALILAAKEGQLDVVKFLLSHGADAHAMNKDGDTALFLTAHNWHPEVYQLLLEHLSEPNQALVGSDAELSALMVTTVESRPGHSLSCLTQSRNRYYHQLDQGFSLA